MDGTSPTAWRRGDGHDGLLAPPARISDLQAIPGASAGRPPTAVGSASCSWRKRWTWPATSNAIETPAVRAGMESSRMLRGLELEAAPLE